MTTTRTASSSRRHSPRRRHRITPKKSSNTTEENGLLDLIISAFDVKCGFERDSPYLCSSFGPLPNHHRAKQHRRARRGGHRHHKRRVAHELLGDMGKRTELAIERSIRYVEDVASVFVEAFQGRVSVDLLVLRPQEFAQMNLIMTEPVRFMLVDAILEYTDYIPRDLRVPLAYMTWQLGYQLGLCDQYPLDHPIYLLENDGTRNQSSPPPRQTTLPIEDSDSCCRGLVVSKGSFDAVMSASRKEGLLICEELSTLVNWTVDGMNCCIPSGHQTRKSNEDNHGEAQENYCPSTFELRVIASILVRFLEDRASAGHRVLQPGFCNEIKRLVPKSYRNEFWMNVEKSLQQFPIDIRGPMELLALQCRYQLGLERFYERQRLPSPSPPPQGNLLIAADTASRVPGTNSESDQAAIRIQRVWRSCCFQRLLGEARTIADKIRETYRNHLWLTKSITFLSLDQHGAHSQAREESVLASRSVLTVIRTLCRRLVFRKWILQSRNDFQFAKCSTMTLVSLLRRKLKAMMREIQIWAAIRIQSVWRRRKLPLRGRNSSSAQLLSLLPHADLLELPALADDDEDDDENEENCVPPSLVAFTAKASEKLESSRLLLLTPKSENAETVCWSPRSASSSPDIEEEGEVPAHHVPSSLSALVKRIDLALQDARKDLLSPRSASLYAASWETLDSPRDLGCMQEDEDDHELRREILLKYDGNEASNTEVQEEMPSDINRILPMPQVSSISSFTVDFSEETGTLSEVLSDERHVLPKENQCTACDDKPSEQMIFTKHDQNRSPDLPVKNETSKSEAYPQETKVPQVSVALPDNDQSSPLNAPADEIESDIRSQAAMRIQSAWRRYGKITQRSKASLATSLLTPAGELYNLEVLRRQVMAMQNRAPAHSESRSHSRKVTFAKDMDAPGEHRSTLQALIRRQVLVMQIEVRTRSASRIQRAWRRSLARSHFSKKRSTLQMLIRCRMLIMEKEVRNRAAEKIQRVWHQYAAKSLLDRHSAALVIQSSYRRKLSVQQYQVGRRGVITFQASARSFLTRRGYRSEKRVTTVTQAFIRMCLATKTSEYRESIVKIQCQARKHLCRKHFQVFKQAATVIQAFFRSLLAPDFFSIRQSAMAVQSAWRQSVCRQQFLSKRCAAVRVQAFVRASLTTKFADICRSVVIVQSIARRNSHREGYLSVRRFAIVLQTFTRGLLAPHFQDLRRSAVMIQGAVRAHKRRQRFLLMRQAAVKLQSIVRGSLVRAECAKVLFRPAAAGASVVKIQAIARGGLSRREGNDAFSPQEQFLNDEAHAAMSDGRSQSYDTDASAGVERAEGVVQSFSQKKYRERRRKKLKRLLHRSWGNEIPERTPRSEVQPNGTIDTDPALTEDNASQSNLVVYAKPRRIAVILGVTLSCVVVYKYCATMEQWKREMATMNVIGKDNIGIKDYLHDISEHIHTVDVTENSSNEDERSSTDDPEHVLSSVIAHALVARAEVHLKAGRYSEALGDTELAISLEEPSILSSAYRISAEAYQAKGMLPEAVHYLHLLNSGDKDL